MRQPVCLRSTEAILKLLKKINREMGVTILLITHQMQVVVIKMSSHGERSGSRRVVVNDQIPESIISLVKEQKNISV